MSKEPEVGETFILHPAKTTTLTLPPVAADKIAEQVLKLFPFEGGAEQYDISLFMVEGRGGHPVVAECEIEVTSKA